VILVVSGFGLFICSLAVGGSVFYGSLSVSGSLGVLVVGFCFAGCAFAVWSPLSVSASSVGLATR